MSGWGSGGDDDAWVDVTTALRFQVFDSSPDMIEGWTRPGYFGFCDPCPGEEKFLRVRYRYRGAMCEVTVGENDALALPNRSHLLPDEWNNSD